MLSARCRGPVGLRNGGQERGIDQGRAQPKNGRDGGQHPHIGAEREEQYGHALQQHAPEEHLLFGIAVGHAAGEQLAYAPHRRVDGGDDADVGIVEMERQQRHRQ